MIDFDQEAQDALEDFDSEDLTDEDADDFGYLNDMWSGHRFDRARLADATVVAHGMVQTFVNAFARDGHYVVTFDRSVSTAGTDLAARNVAITPAPIADEKLTPEEAGQILTGLAVHEISHPRYGRNTWAAVEIVFPRNRVAARISNLLDDIRIERRFVADYPGYAGIFAPTLAYIGGRGAKVHARLTDPINLAIQATRYPEFTVWDAATSAEATWWTDWAARGSKEDAPKRHVAFVREALLHIAAQKAANPKPPKGEGEGEGQGTKSQEPQDEDAPRPQSNGDEEEEEGDSPSDGASEANEPDDDADQDASPSAGDADGDDSAQAPAPDPEMSDDELNAATRDADADEEESLPSCSGSAAVDEAAVTNGTDQKDIADLKAQADEIVEAARNIEDDGHGNRVDVAKSMKGLGGHGRKPAANALAQRYIRNAIMRSRTGRGSTEAFKQRGRIDQGGLHRLALGDARVFEKRTAPSVGKYLIWIMVDCSGSMAPDRYDIGNIGGAAQVAQAIAAAGQGIPSTRMTVWGWSSPFRPAAAEAGVAKVWETGMPADEALRLSTLNLGSTPDDITIQWAARAIKKQALPGEKPVLIVASDGVGDSGADATAAAVAEARKLGVAVYSVAFGGGLRGSHQERTYGRGNFVEWAGSITKTAKPLADLVARITSR